MTLAEAFEVVDRSTPHSVPLGLQTSHQVDAALHVLDAEVERLQNSLKRVSQDYCDAQDLLNAYAKDGALSVIMCERDAAIASKKKAFTTGYLWGTSEHRDPDAEVAWEDYRTRKDPA